MDSSGHQQKFSTYAQKVSPCGISATVLKSLRASDCEIFTQNIFFISIILARYIQSEFVFATNTDDFQFKVSSTFFEIIQVLSVGGSDEAFNSLAWKKRSNQWAYFLRDINHYFSVYNTWGINILITSRLTGLKEMDLVLWVYSRPTIL